MDSGYTSWSIEDFNTALARKYASDRPVMSLRCREAAEAANVAAGNMPVHDVFTGRSARAAKARQALCEGRQAMGWHPWTIARYYGIAPEMVSEALGEDGAPEWLELQETLTRLRFRRPSPNAWAGFKDFVDRRMAEVLAPFINVDEGECLAYRPPGLSKPVTLDSATLEPNKCQCRRCDPGLGPNGLPERFIVCGTCGNKRCPHAEWHGYECSGSNEVGQTPKPADAIDEEAKALHREAMRLADIADESKRAGDMLEARCLYRFAARAEEKAAAMTVVEPSHGVLTKSAEALRGQAEQAGRLPSKTGELGEQTGGLSGDRQVDAMVAGLMKAGGGDGNEADHQAVHHVDSDADRDGGQGHRGGIGPAPWRGNDPGTRGRSGVAGDGRQLDGPGRREADQGGQAETPQVAAGKGGGETARSDAKSSENVEETRGGDGGRGEVAALKAEIERLKAELAAKPALANIERPVRVEILKPHAGPSVLTVTSKYPPIVIDRNAPNEGVTVDGVRYEQPRKRPIVQDAPPKPKKKGGAQRLREKRLATKEASGNDEERTGAIGTQPGQDGGATTGHGHGSATGTRAVAVDVGGAGDPERAGRSEGWSEGGQDRRERTSRRNVVLDAPKPKTKAERDKERRKREREKPLTATVAEVMLGTLAKAKPVKAAKVEEPAPKPVEPKPAVRMVPLPRRPAGAARCDCGLAVQHTGSDGVGRCTRCATEAYRMRKGAAE